MERRGSSSIKVKSQIVPHTIRTALVCAVLEWFLIFLLFIDASFSYLVTKFARYCQLQIPCLLCSRLDHVLGKEKAGFYWDLVCNKHKLKISSLVLCHLHDNLVDVHGMCESCLFSFATVNNSNAETYRLLVGKLGDEPHLGLDPDHPLADDNLSSFNGRKCSCCNEQLISRSHTQMLFQTKTIGYHAADLGAPLVATNGPDTVELKEFTDVPSPKIGASSSRELDIDPLPHVEYEMVKITSDTESIGYEAADFYEPLLATRAHDREELKEFIDVSSQNVIAPLSGKDDIDSLLHVECEKVKVTSDTKSIGYEAADLDSPLLMTNGRDRNKLEDLKDVSSQKVKATLAGWNNTNHLPHVEYEKVKITSDTESEASFSDEDSDPIPVTNDGNQNLPAEYREKDLVIDDLASDKVMGPAGVPQPSIVDSEARLEAGDLCSMASPSPIGHGLEELNWQHIEHKRNVAAPSELVSFSDTLLSSKVAQSSVNMPEETLDFKGVAEVGKEEVKLHDEMAELASNLTFTNEKQSNLKPATSDTSSQIPNLLELGDAYKLAVGSRGRQLSGKLLEQKSVKDSSRLSEDLKLLLSQLSARGIELQLNDVSPRISGNVDELRTDASSSVGMQILQRRISLERNESGISLDGSTVSEIEGESVVDRLKRQVEHDKKIMGALYKELEEERNASAVAANQAMAMITRLQEEKAALHMEALQCLRMIEEQAEYDGEALQKANDLLSEKEKEIQDLKAELKVPKKKFGDLSPTATLVDPNCDLNIREVSVEKLDGSLEQRNSSVCSSASIMSTTCNKTDDTANFTGHEDMNMRSSLEFEDETLYIWQCLKKLGKKLELFSSNDSFLDTVNGNFSAEEKVEVGNWKQLDYKWDTPENGETDVDLETSIIRTESCSAPEGSAFRCKDSLLEFKGNGELEPGQHFDRDIELDALRNEFVVLNSRLEALEAEQSFLEHSISSLSKGDEGLKFIQEIACQVRELHSIGIKRRN